jgi:hypothetical protein
MRLERLTRRRSILAILLGLVLLVTGGVLYLRAHSLQSRLPRIAVGMTGKEAKQILGPPYLTLSRTNARGELFTWVDQMWQVDVLTTPDDRIERVTCVPSNSPTRRLLSWVFP